jgi:tRNA threonylcarbamoyladenosine biosynthesis protein TsaE
MLNHVLVKAGIVSAPRSIYHEILIRVQDDMKEVKTNSYRTNMQQKSYTIQRPEETAALAIRFASLLEAGDVVLLKGDLGAGKSTFARALIQGFCGENTEVPSPTFTLVQTYETKAFPIWHFDLYRLKNPEEIYELGIEEAMHHGVCLIEWPERLAPGFFKACFEVEFAYGKSENERILTFKGRDERLP